VLSINKLILAMVEHKQSVVQIQSVKAVKS